MDLAPTLALLLAVVGLSAFCGWRGARPFDPIKGPRLVPWRLLMITGALAAMLLLVHVAALLGLKTSR